SSAVRTAIAAYPFEKLTPGDAVAFNTPYPAGPGHLNDLCVIAPVFHDGHIVAITANQAHHVDMGGFAPGSMPFGVTEIYQEGLQIPPVKIARRSEINQEILDLILENVRDKEDLKGDLLAQIAANNVGEKRLCDLMDRFGK